MAGTAVVDVVVVGRDSLCEVQQEEQQGVDTVAAAKNTPEK